MVLVPTLATPIEPAYAEVKLDDYDATISYETCLMQNGSFYKAYVLEFSEGIATITLEDGSSAVKESITKGYDSLKDEVKTRLGALDLTVTCDDNGTITVLEYYEDGYTQMYLDYGRTGYDYTESTGETESGFLFTTYIDTDKTMFSDDYQNSSFGWILVRLASIAKLEVAETRILRQYIFGSKYLNSYETDAEVTEYDEYNRVVRHCFYVTPDNLNRTYTIKNRSINLAVWYVMAIGTAGVIAIVTVIAIGKKKNTEEIIYG